MAASGRPKAVTVRTPASAGGIYGEEAVINLPEDFQRLTPKHKTMVCEIVHALLRAEKR